MEINELSSVRVSPIQMNSWRDRLQMHKAIRNAIVCGDAHHQEIHGETVRGRENPWNVTTGGRTWQDKDSLSKSGPFSHVVACSGRRSGRYLGDQSYL